MNEGNSLIPPNRAEDEDSKAEMNSKQEEIKGFSMGIISSVCLAGSPAAVHQMGHLIPHLEMNGLRYLPLFMCLLPYFAAKRILPAIPDISSKCGYLWLLLCVTLTTAYNLFHYASVTYISIGKAESIAKIGTILVVTTVSCIKYKCKIESIKFISILLGCAGVLMVFQKEISTHDLQNQHLVAEKKNHSSNKDIRKNSDSESLNIIFNYDNILGITFAIFSALTCAGGIILYDEFLLKMNSYVFFFWYSLVGTSSSLVLSVIIERLTIPLKAQDWALLVVHCGLAAVYSILSFTALHYASIIVVALSYNTSLLFFFVIQYTIFHEISSGGGLYVEVSGAILTIVSASLPLLYQFIKDYFKPCT